MLWAQVAMRRSEMRKPVPRSVPGMSDSRTTAGDTHGEASSNHSIGTRPSTALFLNLTSPSRRSCSTLSCVFSSSTSFLSAAASWTKEEEEKEDEMCRVPVIRGRASACGR